MYCIVFLVPNLLGQYVQWSSIGNLHILASDVFGWLRIGIQVPSLCFFCTVRFHMILTTNTDPTEKK